MNKMKKIYFIYIKIGGKEKIKIGGTK